MHFFSRALIRALAIIAFAYIQCAGAAEPVQPNVVSCTWIRTAAQLQAMKNNLAGTYCLANDIDLSSIANFVPVGPVFTGKFFGNSHVISNLKIGSGAFYVGLFGDVDGATIQDVGLVNVKVNGMMGATWVGGLMGFADGATTISGIYVTGQVGCTAACAGAGGIAGSLHGTGALLADSWSSAKVSGVGGSIGGAIGSADTGDNILGSHAIGSVICSGPNCFVGGLVGLLGNGSTIKLSYATGPVTGGDTATVGGLVGYIVQGFVQQSFATGPVTGGMSADVGGLVGVAQAGSAEQTYASGSVKGGPSSNVGGLIGNAFGGQATESYSVGPVSAGAGSSIGGLVGSGSPSDPSSFWDTSTSGQATSAGSGEVGLTTAQLRAVLPAGFSNVWAINKTLSYPFLDELDIDFASPLATLVLSSKIFTLLPAGQLDKSNYTGTTAHIDQAALAAVYTMIARAIGLTDNVALLKNVLISKYFWRDKTQKTAWTGPVTAHATLGRLTAIAVKTKIGNNIVTPMNQHRLVILRGTYSKSGGGTATHWMLATMYTKNPNNSLSTVVANDPWTGWQIEIDPSTKTVLSPSNFPLSGFKVNGFQTVTIH